MKSNADETTTLSVYIPQDKLGLHPIERIQKLAERRERSVNYLVVEAILEYLELEEHADNHSLESTSPVPHPDTHTPQPADDLESEEQEDPQDPQKDYAFVDTPSPASRPPLRWLREFVGRIWLRLRARFGHTSVIGVGISTATVADAVATSRQADEVSPLRAMHGEIVEHRFLHVTAQLPQQSGKRARSSSQYLAPYNEFRITRMPDPRLSSRDTVLSTISDIVKTEGPITVDRVNRICTNSAGLRRSGRILRTHYSRAIATGERDGHFGNLSFAVEEDWSQVVLYVPHRSTLSPRVLGPRRDLYEIPMPELGSLIRTTRKLFTAGGTLSLKLLGLSEDDFFRSILKMYGIGRLTKKARKYMAAAEEAHFDSDMYVYELTEKERP